MEQNKFHILVVDDDDRIREMSKVLNRCIIYVCLKCV